MEQRNVVSVSWGDHLTVGEGDGRLATLGALRRRMERWRDDLGAAKGRNHRSRAQDRGYGLQNYHSSVFVLDSMPDSIIWSDHSTAYLNL